MSPRKPAPDVDISMIDLPRGLIGSLSDPDPEPARVAILRSPEGHADPFGDEGNSAVKYRPMHWWQAGMGCSEKMARNSRLISAIVMIAETISLGILSLPSVLATLGLVPGMFLILTIGILATYTGYVYGQYKMRYPFIHSMADAGQQMLGAWGREIFGIAQLIFFIFVMASHILTFSIMMNTLTDHSSCTIVFSFIGMVICLLFSIPRRLGSVSYMSIFSFISIFGAVMVTMVGVGIENPTPPKINMIAYPSFHVGFLAVLNIIFAYAGHVAYFSFISELRIPETYPKALLLLQGVDTTMYLLVAAIVYRFAGPDVASPALGATSAYLQKVSYGIAALTIVIAGVINGHVAAKYIYVRIFRGSNVMSEKTLKSRGSWFLIIAVLWIISWLIAEAVPIFNDLLGLISAMLASLFTFSCSAAFWLCMNWGHYTRNFRKMFLFLLNVFLFLAGLAVCGVGLWASGESIKAHSGTAMGSPFSCANNAHVAKSRT